jgi:hypothetical protein
LPLRDKNSASIPCASLSAAIPRRKISRISNAAGTLVRLFQAKACGLKVRQNRVFKGCHSKTEVLEQPLVLIGFMAKKNDGNGGGRKKERFSRSRETGGNKPKGPTLLNHS